MPSQPFHRSPARTLLIGCGVLAGLSLSTAEAATVSTFHSFAGHEDGSLPSNGALAIGADGAYYGVTLSGIAYRMASDGTFTSLAETGVSYAGLTRGSDGNFYGATLDGGAAGLGTIFCMTPEGVMTTLHSFDDEATGAHVYNSLTLGADGALYGVADGGANGTGLAFRITPQGAYSVLHAFTGEECSDPQELMLADDGDFYGTCFQGGPSYSEDQGAGTIYRMSSRGAVTVVYAFEFNLASYPYSALLQVSDGWFYGTATQGQDPWGVLYRVSAGGVFQVLHEFDGDDGYSNKSALIQASDGLLYGACSFGGRYGLGTLYRYTPGSSRDGFELLSSFRGKGRRAGGSNPYAALVQGSDGAFYGTTQEGGRNDLGTVYRMTP